MSLNVVGVLLWGFAATVVLTVFMYLCQWQGWSRMSLPFMLGTMVTPSRDRANYLGIAFHLLVGWSLAAIYALAFESWGLATWWAGLAIGLVHGLYVVAVLMPMLPYVHPRMANEHDGPDPTRMLEPPGFMGLNYGRRTPIITLAAHLLYGGILGAFYRLSGG
ncbi:MAG: hypothetical protein R3310_10835 [Candidatus Competibacteraceae bacterium]|nr:hypothetical protein [Candidatus Competibacteraceae bacterium]